MEKSWKVILAFAGIFVAGAVFGGFVALGVKDGPASGTTAPAASTAVVENTTPAPVVEQKDAPAGEPKAQGKGAVQPPRPPLLQIPLRWQAPQLMGRYRDRLDLTSEQKEKVDPVIQRATQDYRRLQQNFFKETTIIVQRLQADIRKELTPEQIAKLDALEKRQREIMETEERQREMKKGPGGGKTQGEKRPGKAPGRQSPPASTPSATTSTTS